MEITVNTIYGDVTLALFYDVSNGSYYAAYDESMNFLGELWDYPSFDDDDIEGSIEAFRTYIEDAVDNNELAIPQLAEKSDKVWTATVCIRKFNTVLAYSDVFHTQDKAIEYRQAEAEKWIENTGVKIDPQSAYINGLFMEMADDCRDNIFIVTIKETDIK